MWPSKASRGQHHLCAQWPRIIPNKIFFNIFFKVSQTKNFKFQHIERAVTSEGYDKVSEICRRSKKRREEMKKISVNQMKYQS